MSFYINNMEPTKVTFQGEDISSLYYNGTLVWAPSYDDWGDENGIADEVWWSDLHNWLQTASTEELAMCVGKTKQVTLSPGVLGTTTHRVRCIGYNCDGNQTLTFQTDNTLETRIKGLEDVVMNDPRNDYYYAFPGNTYIKTVSKGTCETGHLSAGTGIPTYSDMKVFYPSVSEMGFTLGQGAAVCFDEFCAENVYKIPYQYYSVPANRVKQYGDMASGGYCQYLTRSMGTGSDSDRCNIQCRTEDEGETYTVSIGATIINLINNGIAPAFVIG